MTQRIAPLAVFLIAAFQPAFADSLQSRTSTSELDAQLNAEDRLMAERRKSMVIPAKPDFTSIDSPRRIALKLILEKSTIRAGECPRFRLELTNIGREVIDYRENHSSLFAKDGGLINSPTIRFYLQKKGAKPVKLTATLAPSPDVLKRPKLAQRVFPPRGATEEEKQKWLDEMNATGRAHATFQMKLFPGETLQSIGDDDSRENFKTLVAEEDFDKPGVYQVRVTLDDRPAKLSQRAIKTLMAVGQTIAEIRADEKKAAREALGPVISNAASLEIVL